MADLRLTCGMYSQFGHQFRVWHSQTVAEKQLFRQQVFLMCESNRDYVSSLNLEAPNYRTACACDRLYPFLTSQKTCAGHQ